MLNSFDHLQAPNSSVDAPQGALSLSAAGSADGEVLIGTCCRIVLGPQSCRNSRRLLQGDRLHQCPPESDTTQCDAHQGRRESHAATATMPIWKASCQWSLVLSLCIYAGIMGKVSQSDCYTAKWKNRTTRAAAFCIR